MYEKQKCEEKFENTLTRPSKKSHILSAHIVVLFSHWSRVTEITSDELHAGPL